MKFRRATKTDFEVYARIYDTEEADVLYRNDRKVDPQKQCEAVRWFGLDKLDAETKKQMKEANQLTPEKFEQELAKPYVRIIFLEDGEETVGFIQLFQIKAAAWKIGYLYLGAGYQTLEVMEELVQYLAKHEKMRQLDVCVIGERICKQLLQIGFERSGSSCYLRWKKVAKP